MPAAVARGAKRLSLRLRRAARLTVVDTRRDPLLSLTVTVSIVGHCPGFRDNLHHRA